MWNLRRASKILLSIVGGVALGVASESYGDPITVKVDQPGAKFSPTFYGLMTEEINYSYDGGLYAELLRNRIFREPPVVPGAGRGRRRSGADATTATSQPTPVPIPHWSVVSSGGAKAGMALDKDDPINTVALTTSLKLTVDSVGDGGRAGVANDGYWGIPVKPSTVYQASFYAKGAGISGPLTVAIESTDGKTVYASGTIPAISDAWKKYNVALTTGADAKDVSSLAVAAAPVSAAGGGFAGRGGPQSIGSVQTQFVISVKSAGTLWLNLVSLMPPTFHDTPNGNRVDIMNLLDEMHPGFLRFPGGNYVEGNRFDDHYDWRRTLGPMENRPGHQGTWSYRSSDGMGLLEYLLWCEDLKMEPVLAVFAGHILGNGNTVVTGDRLEPYVQEALDEIEYVTGDATTKWGGERVKDGHPTPFKLTYVEVGNEDNLSNGLGTYEERFARFYDAIKGKYPNLKIISTVPSNQRNYERNRTPDVEDDHYYFNNVGAALAEVDHYDNYDRSGPKIFVGEWATRLGNPTSNFLGALADAAFLTGLERNADLVVMSCYAPLFVNVNPPYPQSAGGLNYPGGMQWPTDLIGYNADASFGSCSYYVQKMFYSNRGDVVLPIELPSNPDVFACASRDTNGDVILKMVSGRGTAAGMDITLSGVTDVDKNATGWILTGGLDDVNSVGEPEKVAPKAITIDNAAAKFTYQLPSNSVVVLRIKAK